MSYLHIVRAFLSDCKIAKLKPLYIKDSKNFRSIYLLALISKVIERIVYNPVDQFFLQNDILYNYQPGFSKNQSTNIYLSFLNDKLLKGFNKGVFSGNDTN